MSTETVVTFLTITDEVFIAEALTVIPNTTTEKIENIL